MGGEDAPERFRNEFLHQILSGLSTDDSLVVLFDEFDVLDNRTEGQAGAVFFPYLRDLFVSESAPGRSS